MSARELILGPDARGLVVAIRDGRVAAVREAADAPTGARRLACPEAILEPGQVNAHTHIYSALAPYGMPPPEPPPARFLQILERVWWRLDRALDEEALRVSARLYAAEALLAGTTTLLDHHESPRLVEGSLDLLADACDEMGVRALVCYGVTERNGGRDEARRGLAECRRFLEANRRRAIRGAVGLHASFTVSDTTAREAGELARALGTVVHVHVAEDRADVEDARRRGWQGPLERLLDLGALPPGSILAHGVHCSAGEVARAAREGIWFVQNPRSNAGNRVGYPRGLAASDRVALGTDGYPAAMTDEAAALSREAALHGEPAAATAPRLTAGWRLAAERFGLDFAPLAPGSAADLIARRPDGAIDHGVVGGRVVVESGRLVAADLEELRAAAREEAPRLWRRMGALS